MSTPIGDYRRGSSFLVTDPGILHEVEQRVVHRDAGRDEQERGGT